jgi:DNA repair protein RadC
VDNVIPSKNLKHFNPLEPGVDELTRSTLLKVLLHEAEKSCLTRQRSDRIDRHMAALRKLIYRQLELVETNKSKGQNAGQALKLLATMNDLMANYQTLRRRISSLAE